MQFIYFMSSTFEKWSGMGNRREKEGRGSELCIILMMFINIHVLEYIECYCM